MLAKRKDILTGSICSAQSAMGMPNVEAMLSEVRGCFLNRENGVWKFAECVAQRGANPLKTPKATKLFVLQFILTRSLLSEINHFRSFQSVKKSILSKNQSFHS